MIKGLTADISAEIVTLIFAGRKIEAIKRYKDEAGCGLKEAKEYIDRMALLLQKPEVSSDVADDDPITHQIEKLLLEGRKIEAIKVHRELTGSGLRASKEAVEAIEDRLKSTQPKRRW